MRNLVLSLVAGLLIATPMFAQDAAPAAKDSNSTNAVKTDKYLLWQKRHAIAFSAGMPGVGMEYAYNINRHLNLRAGFMAFAFNDFNTDLEISGQPVSINADLNSAAYDLFLEYQPSSNTAFKLVAGIGYLNNIGVNSTVLLSEDIGFGDLIIDNEEIGEIGVDVSWTGIAPYIGFGFGRAIPKKRVGFGLEFGSYYAGGPDVVINATGMLANTSEEAAELEENLASYAWVPRIMARLAIKL